MSCSTSLYRERVLYTLVWVLGVLYALWSFCKSSNENVNLLEPLDFEEGWTILQRKKDVSDLEWVVFTAAFKKYWVLLCVQILCTQFLIPKGTKVLLCFYCVYSILCLILIIGSCATAVYLLYILLMCAIHFTRLKSICYFVTIMSLYLFHLEPVITVREAFVPDRIEGLLIDVGLVWLAARSLSFSLDRIESQTYLKFTLEDFLLIFSYCLYLPVVFTGPILCYQSFASQITKVKRVWTALSFFKAVLCFAKPLYGYFLLEFLLHFVYSSSIQFYPDLIVHFNAWSLCGLGYALPILFYVKYFVIYGLSRNIAKLEHLSFPAPPKCISRTHLPSILWRTFDRGLYLWILKYLYLPIMNGRWSFVRKLGALAVCFLFISLWHGKDLTVYTWAGLNYLGVVIEMLMSGFSSSSICTKFKKVLSVRQKRNLAALVSTPQFMMMCISCSCFLSNLDVGRLIFNKVVLGGVIPCLPTAFIMYCGCHVSTMVKEYEDKNTNKNSRESF